MSVVIITAPTPDLYLADVKAYLRIEHADDDAVIEGFIAAASAWVDGPNGILNRSIWPQTLELRQDDFTAPVSLPYGPVSAIVSVKYIDADGVEQTVGSSVYELADGVLGLAHNQSWPTPRGDVGGVRIRYAAGHSVGEREVQTVKQALLMLIAHWNANREAVSVGGSVNELPMGTRALLAPFLIWAV
ncbi:MAG: head-tail connector protein [Caulobacter sp.]